MSDSATGSLAIPGAESDWRPLAEAGGTAETRAEWRERRLAMERGRGRLTPGAQRRKSAFDRLLDLFGLGLRLTGLYRRGLANALDLQATEITLGFADLPAAFDGFTLLQMTDLHVDALPEAMAAAIELAAAVPVDLCVLTGDYRFYSAGPFEQILPAFRALVARVEARHGVVAVLGNHDGADMVAPLEATGVRLLVNETLSLARGGANLHVTGTDDVHYFETEAAGAALARTPAGFKIALVHSPEIADLAADSGFHLYLTGHTHGGQICLPGGRPIITQLRRFRGKASGLWRHGAVQGYTSTGVGISGLPVRFNCRGEVARITLRRAPAGLTPSS